MSSGVVEPKKKSWKRPGLKEVVLGDLENDSTDYFLGAMDLMNRTQVLLGKMYRSNVWEEIHCRIATGREAHVYLATDIEGQPLVIKLYRCSFAELEGRFDDTPERVLIENKLCEGSRTYNEMLRLSRMKEVGIRCPAPIYQSYHVLAMEFIGDGRFPAPTLADAHLSLDQLHECYIEVLKVMRKLYQQGKVVHGDLNENNLLYYKGHVYIIDISQGVDHDHPYAKKLLEEDCARILTFFRRFCVVVITREQLLDFIINPCIDDVEVDSYLQKAHQSQATSI